MSNTALNPSRCPKCGEPVMGELMGGLCPRCLMAMNMATRTEFTGELSEPGGQGASPKPPLFPEEIAKFFPQFEILECLGRGGMGVVYKARQKSLNRLVALKILAPEREKNAAFGMRFAREAQTLAKLNHPNIITIHDFGETGGMFYLIMEFVDGVNLRRLLQDRKLSPEEALAVVPPICDALQYAHNLGVVHRDIKPENLLLDKEGRIKIADFGIAKILASSGGDAGETRSIIGTPRYMSPEQVAHPERVDHRADIFSLGVVLYEMLTGEAPAGAVVPPSRKVQIDVRLDEIVLRALEREPELRFQQASILKTQLETLAQGDSGRRAPSHEPAHGSGILKFAVAAAVVLALTVIGAIALNLRSDFPERLDAPFPVRSFGLQVGEQMRARNYLWDCMRVELVPDSSQAIWHFDGLKRRSDGRAVQGTLRIAPDGQERWRCHGEGVLMGMEFPLYINPQPDTARAESPVDGFGPLIQEVIRREDADEQGFVFFDFETGRSLPAPFAMVTCSNRGNIFVEIVPALEYWILANRMDVLIHFEKENWSSMNLRMQEDFIPDAPEWGQATAAMVNDVFARWDALKMEREQVTAARQGRGYQPQFDRPKAFRTRSNTMGVMQWAGQGGAPGAVKVRYRLVEGSDMTRTIQGEPIQRGKLLIIPAVRILGEFRSPEAVTPRAENYRRAE